MTRDWSAQILVMSAALIVLYPTDGNAQSADSNYYGYSAQEARRVNQLIERYETDIERIANESQIRASTLRSIALALGLNQPNLTDGSFLEAVRNIAADAASLRVQISSLILQVEALEDSALRTPSAAAMRRAQAAYDAGDLAAAERELGSLRSVRGFDSERATAAWVDAVKAEAEVAYLRGDIERMDTLYEDADERIARSETVRRWDLIYTRALRWYDLGKLRGERGQLERSVALLTERALQLVPRDEFPIEWADTQVLLGLAYMDVGVLQNGTREFRLAYEAIAAALPELRNRDQIGDWANAKTILGAIQSYWGERSGEDSRVISALNEYDEALAVLPEGVRSELWLRIQINRANGQWFLGQRDLESGRIEEALSLYQQIDPYVANLPDVNQAASVRLNHAMILTNLGFRAKDRALLEQAVDLIEDILDRLSADSSPRYWADAQLSLGNAQLQLGLNRMEPALLDQAVQAYENALSVTTQEEAPGRWQLLQQNLCGGIQEQRRVRFFPLPTLDREARDIAEALPHCIAAAEAWDRNTAPLKWADAQYTLGALYLELGSFENDTGNLRLAERSFLNAIDEYCVTSVTMGCAVAHGKLASAYQTLGLRGWDSSILMGAVHSYSLAQAALAGGSYADEAASMEMNRAMVEEWIEAINRGESWEDWSRSRYPSLPAGVFQDD